MDALRAQLRSSRQFLYRIWRCTAILAVTAAGCGETPAGETRRAPSQGEGGSPYSLDSALALFRHGLAPVSELENAESSIDRVIAKLAQSVEQSDTAALKAIAMSRREFAYLYYPASPFTRSPTKQEPGLAWFLHIQHSQKGVTRLLNRYGGRPLRILRNECKAPPRVEADNVLWYDCVQAILEAKDTVPMRLFGGIYERNGRFKILSYSNDL